MKDRPILMSAPMVRATLREVDPKTQTRRVIKLPLKCKAHGASIKSICKEDEAEILQYCPYGQPGDRLWVRETYYAWGKWEMRWDAKKGRNAWYFVDATIGAGFKHRFAADEAVATQRRVVGLISWWKRPAIFMPREVSRILLDNTGVRVEHLQSITYIDAQAEGVSYEKGYTDPRDAYQRLWTSINGPFGPMSWEENPWVWCISFRRITNG